jgi:2-iminoacetate synthase ThiH
VRQNSSHRLGHRWLLRHIQNSNRSRHLQASSPQNSQPKKNPKKETTSNAPVSALQLLHCSRRCDSALFSIAFQRENA